MSNRFRSLNEDSFLHEPPMSSSVTLSKNDIDTDKLSNLLGNITSFKKIEKIDQNNKPIIIDMINEENQISKKKEVIDEEYNRIKKSFPENSIPQKNKLINQKNEMDYVTSQLAKNLNFKNGKSATLEQKKKETEKLLCLWSEICKNIPQLADCANLIDIHNIEITSNSDLMNHFQGIVEQISSKLSS